MGSRNDDIGKWSQLPSWAKIGVVTAPLGVLLLLAAFLKPIASIVADADTLNDVTCKYRTSEDGRRPGHCPALPQTFGKEAATDIKAVRRGVDDIKSGLAKLGPAPTVAKQDRFRITPTSWNKDQLRLSLSIAPSTERGSVTVFGCERLSENYSWIAELAFDTEANQQALSTPFNQASGVLVAQVTPSKGTPYAVISSWDFTTMSPMQPRVVWDGVVDCKKTKGKF